jgi:hypothetical protein
MIHVSHGEGGEKYGPQTSQVEKLIGRIGDVNALQARRLSDRFVGQPGRAISWDANRDALWGAGRDTLRYATWIALGAALRGAGWNDDLDKAKCAAIDAASALLARDLIREDGFAQHYYDLLTNPWRSIIGIIHPLDREICDRHSA